MLQIMVRISDGSSRKRWNDGVDLPGCSDGEGLRGLNWSSLENCRGLRGVRSVLTDWIDF